jgi:hypothetical protein
VRHIIRPLFFSAWRKTGGAPVETPEEVATKNGARLSNRQARFFV